MLPEIRRNVVTGAVSIVSPGREKSLEQLARVSSRDWSSCKPTLVSGEECPFCEGHEKATPPEIMAYRSAGTHADHPGWWVRSFSNLGSAVDQNVPRVLLTEERMGICGMTPGFGYHSVIAESSKHDVGMHNMSPGQVREVVNMWRDISRQYGSDRNIASVIIFKNWGPTAGASQPHPHSQIIGLPVLPTDILTELRGAEKYFSDHHKCPFCVDIDWELSMQSRVVVETQRFVAWCPYASSFPYQTCITPKDHQSSFAQISTHGDQSALSEFAWLMQDVLIRIKSVLRDPDWNLYFHSAPTNNPDLSYYHWYCQIVPVTRAIRAGFEWATGTVMLPRSPESAARDLREAQAW